MRSRLSLRFSDKPMIATKEAVTSGLSQACADGLVGIGRGGSISALLSRYCKQSIPLDASEDGLWIIPPFDPEPAKVHEGEKTAVGDDGSGERPAAGSTDSAPATGERSDTSTAKDTGAKGNSAALRRPGCRFQWRTGANFSGASSRPSVRMKLKRLRLGVQFEMVLSEGATLNENDAALKTMKEAARQLGLTLEIEQ